MKDVKEKTGDLQGFNYVLTGIAKDNPDCKKSVGQSPEERALIQQWLQYAVILRGKSVSSELLKEINTSLASSTFVAGHCMTLADPVLFLSLYSTYVCTFMHFVFIVSCIMIVCVCLYVYLILAGS
jgi:hypothetical protein